MESLESRQLFSAAPLDLSEGVGARIEPTSLGAFKLKSKANVKGDVGAGVSSVRYQLDVTAAVNLTAKLSKLKQSDTLSILFGDGSVTLSATSWDFLPALEVTQRDAYGYWQTIARDMNADGGTASVRFSATAGAEYFVLVSAAYGAPAAIRSTPRAARTASSRCTPPT